VLREQQRGKALAAAVAVGGGVKGAAAAHGRQRLGGEGGRGRWSGKGWKRKEKTSHTRKGKQRKHTSAPLTIAADSLKPLDQHCSHLQLADSRGDLVPQHRIHPRRHR
jgi:hypothetical protein